MILMQIRQVSHINHMMYVRGHVAQSHIVTVRGQVSHVVI